jgi:tetratricopeptide (TPR) repeat protein
MDMAPHTHPARRRLVALAAIVCVVAGCRHAATPLDKAKSDVQRNPRSAAAYINLGNAYTQAKLTNDAFMAYSIAARLEPTSYDAVYQLGATLLTMGSPRDGLVWARQAVALRPKSAQAHELVGRLLLAAHAPEAAIGELRRAAQLDGDNVSARLNLCSAYAMMGNSSDAISQAREVVQLQPRDSNAHFALADILQRFDKLSEAQVEYDKAVALDPRARDARLRLAMLLLRMNTDLATARRLAQEADRIEPGDGMPSAVAAWSLYLSGDRMDAVMELRAVVASHPQNYFAWVRLTDGLSGIGQPKLAAQAAAQAARIAPKGPAGASR